MYLWEEHTFSHYFGTMPLHTHECRIEVYMYFDIAEDTPKILATTDKCKKIDYHFLASSGKT